jgi:hypothetical protein
MIASCRYVVTRDQGDWTIRYNGDFLGRFASCPRAIRAAVEAADTTPSYTDVCEVVVERSPYDRYTFGFAELTDSRNRRTARGG